MRWLSEETTNTTGFEKSQQGNPSNLTPESHAATTQTNEIPEPRELMPRKPIRRYTFDDQLYSAGNFDYIPPANSPAGKYGTTWGLEPVAQLGGETLKVALPHSYGGVQFPTNTGLQERHDRPKGPNEPVATALPADASRTVSPSSSSPRDGFVPSMPNHKSEESLADLQRATKHSQEAADATPTDHPDRAMRLNDLGLRYLRKYDRFQNSDDLEQAIRWIEEAAVAAPSSLPDRFNLTGKLDGLMQAGCRQHGVLQDIDQVIKWAKAAVEILPADHPEWAAWAGSLGGMFGNKYAHTKAQSDFNQAISWTEKAVAAIPADLLLRPTLLCNLVCVLTVGNQQETFIQEFHRIIRIYYEVWHCHIAPPATRIKAAREAALLLIEKKMWQDASALLERATKMLPLLSLGSGSHMSKFTGIASEAFSIALQAGEDAAHCLRLLELGRGIITSFPIGSRNSSSELQLKHLQIFNKLNHLRVELDSPLAIKEQGNARSEYLESRAKTAQDLEETLISIRQLQGFEGFQLPPRSEDLMAMASDGPIIILSSTSIRSDAIIVTRTGIKTLRLPQLSYTLIKEWVDEMPTLVYGGPSTYTSRNKRMELFLLDVWNMAVEPILKELQLDAVADSSALPRIWWIGIGLLATVPFHAAGDHTHGSTRNTLSRAISSYSPTIKALSYAREKKLKSFSTSDYQLLLVTMPKTPGKKNLKNAPEEVDNIVEIVEGMAKTTRLDSPSPAQVLAGLPFHHIAHFACLGLTNPGNPSESHLLLSNDDGLGSNGLKPMTVDKLTVKMVSNKNIEHAQIAYLSASGTPQRDSLVSAEEPISIASGLQLAGFSHVLSTQWFSADSACLKVTRDFYSYLFKGKARVGGSYEDHRIVSASYHRAVENLRDANRRQPIKWAPFIHTGA